MLTDQEVLRLKAWRTMYNIEAHVDYQQNHWTQEELARLLFIRSLYVSGRVTC